MPKRLELGKRNVASHLFPKLGYLRFEVRNLFLVVGKDGQAWEIFIQALGVGDDQGPIPPQADLVTLHQRIPNRRRCFARVQPFFGLATVLQAKHAGRGDMHHRKRGGCPVDLIYLSTREHRPVLGCNCENPLFGIGFRTNAYGENLGLDCR